MEEALNDTRSTNKRLTSSDKNYIKDPKLDAHEVRSASHSEVTLKNCENPKISVAEELTTAEGQTAFVNKPLSKCTNDYADDLKKIQCYEDRGISINGSESSSKTDVVPATGLKTPANPSSISNSVGNYESCLDMDIQREEEVSCHLVQQSLETMRERIASYISYSGSESGTSDSETLDLNDQKKEVFQTSQIIEKENAPKYDNGSNGLKETENVADRNSEVEKESTFSGSNWKFSMKWNITAKKVDSVNSLKPVQGTWDKDALVSHTDDERATNTFELLPSIKNSSNSPDGTTQSGKTSEKIFDDKGDICLDQNQTKTFSVNEASDRCISDKTMTSRHDSSRNDSSNSKKAQENTLKVQDECSREEYEQKPEDSREMSSNFKKENRKYIGSKETEIKDEDCTSTCERPRHENSQNINKKIKNANTNKLRLDFSSFQEKSLKDEASKSKDKTSSACSGILEDSSPLNSNVRYPRNKQRVLHTEEKKSEELNSVTKYNSSGRGTKNVTIKKECLDSGITSDESVTERIKKNVHNYLKYRNRDAEDKGSTSKQTSPERRTFKVYDDKETRNDDAKTISNRRQTRQSISLDKEHGWQRNSRESSSIDRQSVKQSHFDNDDEDDWKSSSWRRNSRRSASPEKERWQSGKSRERTSLDRDSKRSNVDNDDDDYESRRTYYRSRSPRRSASPEKERWQRKSRERTSLDRETKRSNVYNVDDDYESRRTYYRSSSPRRSASPEKERWQRKSRERTSLDRETKRSNVDNDDDDYESRRTYYRSRSPRRSASPEKERWQRKSRERRSLDRETKRSNIDNDDDVYESRRTYYRSRSPRRSASPEKERWQRKSRERRSVDRETKRSNVDNDDDDYESRRTYYRSRSPRRSASPEKERWQRKSRERTSLDRETKRSNIDNDDDYESRRTYYRSRSPRRSASPEKERWQRKSRESRSRETERETMHGKRSNVDSDNDNESKSRYHRSRDNSRRSVTPGKESGQRMSLERDSKYSKQSHFDNDDDNDWKNSSRRRYSRRSASLEKERWQRTSRESRSTERESAVGDSRNRNDRSFRSPVLRSSRMRQDRPTGRRQITESPDRSWIHNIVVKIADPPRGPIRKRRKQNNRRFIQRNKVERSSNATEEERRLRVPSTSEDKSENDPAQKKKRRWTYDDYTKQSDGSLKRKREFSVDEEEHFAWKRYDDERTMPYQGYADSQVQSLLKQLCGEYLTKLYSKEHNTEEKSPSQDAPGSENDLKNHRSWFITSSEWISHGAQATTAEDSTEQTVNSKDSSTKNVPIVWHTVPLLTSTKKGNERDGKTKTEGANGQENLAKMVEHLSFNEENEIEQTSMREGSSTSIEKMDIQTSLIVNADEILNNQSQNTERKQNQTVQNNMSVGTNIISSFESGIFTFGSLGASDSWNTSTERRTDAFMAGQMTRNDLLVMMTPSSYWYEKQLLKKQEENLPKAESKTDHRPSLYIPTSFSSSRLTNVSSFSVCFHCDTSKFDLSPQIMDSLGEDEDNEKTGNGCVPEHAKTPQTGKSLMEKECSIHTSAKRQLDFDNLPTPDWSSLSENNFSLDANLQMLNKSITDKSAPTKEEHWNKDGKSLHQGEKNDHQLVREDNARSETNKNDSPQTNLPQEKIEKKNDHQLVEEDNADARLETNENDSPKTNLPQEKIEKNDHQLVKEDNAAARLETNENDSPKTNMPQEKIEKKNDHQLIKEDNADARLETNENDSPKPNLPQEKTEKKNDHQLVEENNAEVLSETNEKHFPRTILSKKKIGKKYDISSSMLKVAAEDPKCKAGEEMWELALKSTSSETSDDGDNAIDKSTAITKLHPKSGDLDVAVVKPSPRQKLGSALNETSGTLTYQGENDVIMVNPANASTDKTREESGAAKMLVQNKPFVSQMKVSENLEYSKNTPKSSRCLPSSTSELMSSTPHGLLQKRPKDGKLNFVGVANEKVLAVGVNKKVTENFPQEILPGNLQPAWGGADFKWHGSQGPHVRLMHAPPPFYHQDQCGHNFQTPNPQQQQQQQADESHMVQPPFYNKNVVQHHEMNNKHPSTNSSLNAKVMPPLSNHTHETFPEQQKGNSKSFLQNQTIFIRDSPFLVNQQHAMMPKQDFRSVNGSFQGLLFEAQNNLSPSMPLLNDSFVDQGIDRGHCIHSLSYPTVPTEPVYFQSPEHQQQHFPHQQQHIHIQQQQQQKLQQHQEIHLQHHQQKLQQQQHIQYQQQQQQQQQQRQQQEQKLQQQQKLQQLQQQQQQQNSQQQLQQQQTIPDVPPPIQQQQTVATQPPRHYPILEGSTQIEKWHDDFLRAPINQDDLSHIPWGQHALDLAGYLGDLHTFPQYRQIRTPLPQNAPAFFNAPNTLSE